MDDSAAAGMMIGFIGVAIVLFFLVCFYVVFVLYLLTMQRCFNAVRPEFRPGFPVGLIWLALIPALGFFVVLTAIVLLSTSLKKEGEARGTSTFGDGGLAVGLTAMVLGFISWIPFIGVLFGLASLVCWILHWVKIAGYRTALAGAAAAPAPAAFAPPPLPVTPPPLPPQATAPQAPAAPSAAMPATSQEEATMRFANVGNAKLVCTIGVVQGMSFAVGNGVTLGRSPEAEVCIPDPQISNRHAWVGVLNNQLVLRDLKSTNGTYLNDELTVPVQEQILKDGDVIVLGKHNQMKLRVTLA